MDQLVARGYPEGGPGAAVLVVRGGRTILRRGYGLASVELGVKVEPGQLFRIGSVTKTFTAAAVLLLVEEGRVALDAPIGRYLAGTPRAWRAVTVEHLLTHTSGIPSFTEARGFWRRAAQDLTPEESLQSIWNEPLQFRPGTAWHYDNSGYVLLGMVIEKVSGQRYGDFLQERILGPLGLSHTRLGDTRALIPGMVSGYAPGPVPAAPISLQQAFAAGALVSTVDDLAAFTLALHQGRLLKPETVRRMTTPYRLRDGSENPGGYGYGLSIRRLGGRTLVGHAGDIDGFHAMVEADPAAGAVAVFLHNGQRLGPNGDWLTRRLLALAEGHPVPERPEVQLPTPALAELAGRYGQGSEVLLEGDHLVLVPSVGPRLRLRAASATDFFAPDDDDTIRFERDGAAVLGLRQLDGAGSPGPLVPKRPAAPVASPPRPH
jgi:serine beta-lactamase-like protein LACTB